MTLPASGGALPAITRPLGTATSFAPVAVTPDELGGAWLDGRVHLPLHVSWNGEWIGSPSGAEMHFSFFDLINHLCKTRAYTAGTILGSGTISNADRSKGWSCLAEARTIASRRQARPSGPARSADMARLVRRLVLRDRNV